METFWFFWLRFRRAYDSAYDSDFWFLQGHKRSYDTAYDYDSNSVASKNQPLRVAIIFLFFCLLRKSFLWLGKFADLIVAFVCVQVYLKTICKLSSKIQALTWWVMWYLKRLEVHFGVSLLYINVVSKTQLFLNDLFSNPWKNEWMNPSVVGSFILLSAEE